MIAGRIGHAPQAERLLAVASAYLQAHPDLPARQRIDVIALSLTPDDRLLGLEHIEDAVSE